MKPFINPDTFTTPTGQVNEEKLFEQLHPNAQAVLMLPHMADSDDPEAVQRDPEAEALIASWVHIMSCVEDDRNALKQTTEHLSE